MEIPRIGFKSAAHTFAISKEIANIKLPIELGSWEGSGTRSNGYEKGGRRPSERGESGTELNISERKTFHKGLPLAREFLSQPAAATAFKFRYKLLSRSQSLEGLGRSFVEHNFQHGWLWTFGRGSSRLSR